MSAIDKDLFRALFGRVSKHSFETYEREVLRRLPSLLLQSAQQACPAVAECSGFEDLQQCLKTPSVAAQTWKNAELYPYLNYVAFPNNGKRQLCVNALMVHTRIAELTPETNPDVRYWRFPLSFSDSNVLIVSFDGGTTVRMFDLGWNMELESASVAIYRPHNELFNDVEPRLYGYQSSARSNCQLNDLLLQAFTIIHEYSEYLYRNIAAHISTISLLKEVEGRPISYSLRNKYIGAIFVTVTSPLEMAEQIIHEYYHQCIWPWWLVEAPSDLPDVDLRVASPITGAMRSLPTMMQAILIYASLLDFYIFAADRNYIEGNPAAKLRASNRMQMIRKRFDDLANSVVHELQGRPASLAFVRAIVDLRVETLAH
jgi:hypothetical protein